jgi:hypothetical protein
MWQIDLAGDQADIGELKRLAPHCHCVIGPGHNGRECLSGSRFDSLPTAEQMREEATKILNQLNGIARMGWSGFCSELYPSTGMTALLFLSVFTSKYVFVQH